MRTLTLGIALSALVGSLALAQSGTGSGTTSGNGTANGTGNTSTKSSNGQTNTQNGNRYSGQNNGQSKGSSNTKSNPTAAPTSATGSPTTVASNGTSNVAKVSGRTVAQTLSDNDNLDTLESLLNEAGLTGTFSGNGSYTLFAPTDAAFELLGEETLATLTNPQNKSKLTAILTYHVVPGMMSSSEFAKAGNANTVNGQRLGLSGSNGSFTVEKVAITQTDIKCSNGMIHVIDAVLVPTQSNLVEVAGSSGNYSTFLKACKAAGLDATLVKNGSFTVFAPTDEAFAKLPPGMLEMLMQPENRLQLREILSYHVVPGTRFYSNNLGDGGELHTVLGESLPVSNDGSTVTLGNGAVVTADMQASNGVMHGVDTVLLPGVSATSTTVKGKGKPSSGTTATGKEKESN